MPRKPREKAEGAGSDSFLDVVTNIVGILIILVMVVGIRVKNAPARPAPSDWDEEQMRADIGGLEREADALERNVHKVEGQIADLASAARQHYLERGTLAYLIAENERGLAASRKSLDDEKRQAFDLQRAYSKLERDLQSVDDQTSAAQAAAERKSKPIKIQSRPTPISHAVFGDEVHFQLRGGHIAWAPLTELAELCHQDAQGQIHRLQNTPDISETLGPMHGFRARYVAERLDLPFDPGRFKVIFSVELIPLREGMGETIDQALIETSMFRDKLAEFNPRKTTVTLWTYADSFQDYGRLKDELYRLGFSVAARPLQQDWYISGSNYGSHSAAQ